MAKKEVCPRDEIADPGTAVFPIDMHGFAEGLVSFRTLCGLIVAGEICSESSDRLGLLQWQTPLDTLYFSPAFS